MSAKPTDLGYHKKDIGRCRFCKETILWGYMFGKKHPFNVTFDDAGDPHKTDSHMDTCPKWKSNGLKAQADAHTAAIHKWCEACQISRCASAYRLESRRTFGGPRETRQTYRMATRRTRRPLRGLAPGRSHPTFQENSRPGYEGRRGPTHTRILQPDPLPHPRVHDVRFFGHGGT